MKKKISEQKLNNIVKEVVNEVKQVKYTVDGRHIGYSPERSGFNSKDKWERQDFDTETFRELVTNCLSSIAKARDYAREHGEGEWYMLLNEIIGELWDRREEL